MGAINVKHTGSGADIALSSDGTSLLLDGTAIGGGGGAALELYAENPSSPTAPVATGTNAVAIGRDATGTNSDAFSFGYNARAQGQFSTAIGASSLAGNAQGSTAIGFTAVSQGTKAVAIGDSYASGTGSFAAAIANNTSSYGATGANSVAIGDLAKSTNTNAVCISNTSTASGTNSAVLGGFGNTASGSVSVVAGGAYNSAIGTYSFSTGQSNTARGAYSTIIGGRGNETTANASYSVASGYQAEAAIEGKVAHASGRFSLDGDAQSGAFVLRSDTTDATPEALTATNSAASTTNQIILPNNSAYSFSGTIIARQQASAGSDYASWEIKGALLRDGSAATTVLGNGIQNKLFASAGASAWAVALTADTTNGGLKIEVTGAAATNIRWVATVNTSEVTY